MANEDEEQLDDEERLTADWPDVDEHRYGAGLNAGSGRINPFFQKLGAPDRRFGMQLLVVGAIIVLLPVFGLKHWPFYFFLLFIAAILIVGGVGHIRAASSRRRGRP
jgi:hypothetical protein